MGRKTVMWYERYKLIVVGVFVLLQCTYTVDANQPSFVGRGSNVTVAVGRDATITCKVDNLMTYKVAWLRVDTQTILTIGGHVITKNHRITITHGDGAWILSLRDVEPLDSGYYMCQVNTEPMMSQLHQLQVVVPPDIDDDSSSTDVVAKEGDNIQLKCIASGTPAPTITWRREDSKLFTVSGKTQVPKWNGPWLNISSIKRELSGAYLCIASNGIPPSVSKRIQISVMFAPKIWADRVAIRALNGDTASLQCLADSYPPPLVYWTLNGEQRLSNSSKHRILSTLKGYTYTVVLKIDEMSREDAGAYRCYVENGLGRAQAELFLYMITTTSTTSTTSTTTKPSTTTRFTTIPTTRSSFITTISTYYAERDVEPLHRGVISDPDLDNPYVVLSQHQMQNLEMITTM